MGSQSSSGKLPYQQFKEYLEHKILTSIYPPPTARIIKSKCQRPIKLTESNYLSFQQESLDLESLDESAKPDTIFLLDGRKRVFQTAKWPYSVHGIVCMKFLEWNVWGTGTLIGPNIVLTAGHNLFDYEKKVYADLESMQFLPAMNGQMLPFGIVEVEKYFVSPGYIKEQKEDYGVLILKTPIGEETGYFGLACLDPVDLKRKTINIIGYPGDKVGSKPKTFEMWGMKGPISDINLDHGLIHYLINTSGGQSGSGIYYKEDGEYFVCGIHTQGSWACKTGTLITREVYQQIYKWIQENTPLNFSLSRVNPHHLEFNNSKIDADCISLLHKYDLDGIISLNLNRNQIKAEGALALAQNTSWINLSQLYLSNNNIGDEGVKALTRNPSWINLSQLYLSGNSIRDEGAKALAQNTVWINLSQLDLSKNKISNAGGKALAQNRSWINFSQLDLSDNNIDKQVAKELAQNPIWNLLQLYLSDHQDHHILMKRTSTLTQDPLTNIVLPTGSEEIEPKSQELVLAKRQDSSSAVTSLSRRKCHQTYKWLKEKISQLLLPRGVSCKLKLVDCKINQDSISLFLKYNFSASGEGVEQHFRTQFLQLNFSCHQFSAKGLKTLLSSLPGILWLSTLYLDSIVGEPSSTNWHNHSVCWDESLKTYESFPLLHHPPQFGILALNFEVVESLPTGSNISNSCLRFNSIDAPWAEVLQEVFSPNSILERICPGRENPYIPWSIPRLNRIFPFALNDSYASLPSSERSHRQINDEDAEGFAGRQLLDARVNHYIGNESADFDFNNNDDMIGIEPLQNASEINNVHVVAEESIKNICEQTKSQANSLEDKEPAQDKPDKSEKN